MIWRPAFLLSRGEGLQSAQSQLWSTALERCSLVRLCQTSDVHRGGRGGIRSEQRDGGRQRRARIIQRQTILQGFSVFAVQQDRHSCPWVCEQLPDPCVLYTRNSASISASMKIRRLWSLLWQIVYSGFTVAEHQPQTTALLFVFVCCSSKAWNSLL